MKDGATAKHANGFVNTPTQASSESTYTIDHVNYTVIESTNQNIQQRGSQGQTTLTWKLTTLSKNWQINRY